MFAIGLCLQLVQGCQRPHAKRGTICLTGPNNALEPGQVKCLIGALLGTPKLWADIICDNMVSDKNVYMSDI